MACADVLNFLSQAAHLDFSLALGTEDAVSPRNIVSWDEFAVLLVKKRIKGAKVCTTTTAQQEAQVAEEGPEESREGERLPGQ